jgi:radical SAM superfamily enzyme YgiQ (UPF0313 family)
MKVLLVRPSQLDIFLDSKSSKKRVGDKHQPLGLLTLGTMLKTHSRHDVRICDECVDDVAEKDIDIYSPDLVAVSITTPLMKRAAEIAAYAKSKGATVAMGGPHVSAVPEQVLEESRADIAAVGEGDYIILDVCNGKAWEEIGGIAFRRNGRISLNLRRPPIEDLDALPFLERDLLDIDKYQTDGELGFPLPRGQTLMRLFTSRGCQYRCGFCASYNVWGRKVRYRSAESVLDEIRKIITDYEVRNYVFMDDFFTASLERVQEICETVIREGLKIRWVCSSRINMPKETLLLMKRAGCELVSFGIESGSDKVLRSIRKGQNREQIFNTFQTTREIGLRTKITIIVGLPAEEEEDFLKTLKLVRRINPNYLWVSMFYPFPGTELYDIIRKTQPDFDFKEVSYFQSNDPVILARHRRLVRDFYLRWGYMKNILANFSLGEIAYQFQLAKAFVSMRS